MNLIKVLGIIEGHGDRDKFKALIPAAAEKYPSAKEIEVQGKDPADTASRLLEMAKNQDLLSSQLALEEENQARRQRKYPSTTSAA
jgi:hypothetical protein